ncbi:MAG: metalloregulator ArsR/SmtB family transcription factor [bacterium]|nr:metalloregulator ArsR/SmtB family transcription factor [bacterium]
MKPKCLKCLKSIAVPARFQIFNHLMKTGNKNSSVSSLVKLTGLRQPTVTFHLNQLQNAGLITKNRVGKNVFCRLSAHCAHCPLYA